jgi:hypothetical protein
MSTHGATTQKTAIFVLTAVRTSNPTKKYIVLVGRSDVKRPSVWEDAFKMDVEETEWEGGMG